MVDRRAFLGLVASGTALTLGACRSARSGPTPVATPSTTTTPPTPPESADRPSSTAETATPTTADPFVRPAVTPPAPASAPFGLGVASGDPDHRSVILWTRLVDGAAGNPVTDGTVSVTWELATDPDMARVVTSGSAETGPESAHSVHVEVGDLDPGTTYHFRFGALGGSSPVGRTRTLPAPDDDVPVRLVVASCQNYEDGLFTAWRRTLEDAPDLVVFLGDYIYVRDAARSAVRSHGAPAPRTLGEYRRRWALYTADPDLQAARGSVPWATVWDDNEVRSDYSGAAGLDDRTLAAYRAWWEHTPTRAPAPTERGMTIHREFSLGRRADLWVLDGRQYRDPGVCEPVVGLPGVGACPEMDDTSRTMLGTEQESWLESGLAASTATWQIVAQQTVVSDMSVTIGDTTVVNDDQWDGFPAARRRLLGALAGVPNPVVMSGDIHAAMTAELELDGRPVAPEFVTPSITSALTDVANLGLQFAAAAHPAISDIDTSSHGYLLVDIGDGSLTVSRRLVDPLVPGGPPVEDGPVTTIEAVG